MFDEQQSVVLNPSDVGGQGLSWVFHRTFDQKKCNGVGGDFAVESREKCPTAVVR